MARPAITIMSTLPKTKKSADTFHIISNEHYQTQELLGDGDNIRTGAAIIQDSTLINLRQARAINEVCCSLDDIIYEDKNCDDTEGFK